MLATLSLIRKEFSAYFLSPIAYVVLAVFLAVTGGLFSLTVERLTAAGPQGVEFPMRVLLGQILIGHPENLLVVLVFLLFWLIYLAIPPLLTMRLFAEERSTGTLEMLMTAPLRDWQVVLSKYAACLAFYVVLWLPTLVYLPVLLDLHAEWRPAWTVNSWLLVGGLAGLVVAVLLGLLPTGTVGRMLALCLSVPALACVAFGAWRHYGHDPEQVLTLTAGIDPMPVLSSYLGLLLAGAMLLALGMFISSLVQSQMVAFLISLFLSLGFIAVGLLQLTVSPGSPLYPVLSFLSVPLHFDRDFSRGVVDTRHLVLYGSVALFCVFMTIRSLESRRWR